MCRFFLLIGLLLFVLDVGKMDDIESGSRILSGASPYPQKEAKLVGQKLSIKDAQTALVKLVEGGLQKELEEFKIITEAERKMIVDYLGSKEKLAEVRSGNVRYHKELPGHGIIGDWTLLIDECRFYAVIPKQVEIIRIEGTFLRSADKSWMASIDKVARGNKGVGGKG